MIPIEVNTAKQYIERAHLANNSLINAHINKDIFGVIYAAFATFYNLSAALYVMDDEYTLLYHLPYEDLLEYIEKSYVKCKIYNSSFYYLFEKAYKTKYQYDYGIKTTPTWDEIRSYSLIMQNTIDDYFYFAEDQCNKACSIFSIEPIPKKSLRVIIKQYKNIKSIDGLIAFLPQVPVDSENIASCDYGDVLRLRQTPFHVFETTKLANENTKKVKKFIELLQSKFNRFELEVDNFLLQSDLDKAREMYKSGLDMWC